MADSKVPTSDSAESDPRVIRLDEPAGESDASRRLIARLATLDLDPPTLELLTAILTADLDLRDLEVDEEAPHDHAVPATT